MNQQDFLKREVRYFLKQEVTLIQKVPESEQIHSSLQSKEYKKQGLRSVIDGKAKQQRRLRRVQPPGRDRDMPNCPEDAKTRYAG